MGVVYIWAFAGVLYTVIAGRFAYYRIFDCRANNFRNSLFFSPAQLLILKEKLFH